jgi:hypothetical protein
MTLEFDQSFFVLVILQNNVDGEKMENPTGV